MAVKSGLSEQKLGYIREFVNDRDPKEEYKLIQSIGTGTYGEVYKALRLRTKELAAVKIIKIDAKDDVRAILQEIQTLRDCKHSNIVQFFGSYFRNNKLWICMEFCGGFSMQDIYTNIRRPIEENCIAFVTRETLRGIEYMHKAGKIHRDIKGANILLTNDGDVKIADFGVAAQITQTIQRRNSFIGTPYWMAPEVAAVERKGGYDEKCDIWALGITAMEYAELQPPLFDLHPMRALRILGMRSYKPPTLRNKAAWSSKFHSFLKAALTKSEKKRPTAQALLRHELVTQPHLSRVLTLRLLELNRNPDRFVSCASATANTSVPVSSGTATPGAVQSTVLSSSSHLDSPTAASTSGDSTENNKSTKSPGSSSKESSKRKFSALVSERPQPPEKMHTPWTGRLPLEIPTSTASSGSTPVSSPIQSGPKPWAPAERITSTRNAVPHVNGVVSNSTSPSGAAVVPQKSLLEEIRIMDELPTPLPAYVSEAPTATPAPKPSGDYDQLLSSGKAPKSTVQPTVGKPPPAPGAHVPIEALVQRRVASSASPMSPTRIAISDSSRVASSGSSHSSSCSSASTSPRSSCPSLVMESVKEADEQSHLKITNLGDQKEPAYPESLQSLNGSFPPDANPAKNVTQSIAAPEYLTVMEPVVLQGSLEAQFLPIDGEAILLASQPTRPNAEPITIRPSDKVSPSVTAPASAPSTSPLSSATILSTAEDSVHCSASSTTGSGSNEEDSDSNEATSCDDLSEDEGEVDDQLTDSCPDDSSFRGTVTTIDSVTSSSCSPNLSMESIPHNLTSNSDEHSVESQVREALQLQLSALQLDGESETVALCAASENTDAWDLEIAGDELLAADGLLNLNRSRPDSLSDRISEFGFRIHGSEGEDEEEEDEDDEVEDFEFLEPVIDSGIVIPDNIPPFGLSLQAARLEDRSPSPDPTSWTALEQPNDVQSVEPETQKVIESHTSESVTEMEKHQMENDAITDEAQADPLKEFYPDKSGEELMSLLRQLKFAQKFAWLSGTAVLPTTLSALANLQSTKISLNGTAEMLPNETKNNIKNDTLDFPTSTVTPIAHPAEQSPSPVNRVQSEPPLSPVKDTVPVLMPAASEPIPLQPSAVDRILDDEEDSNTHLTNCLEPREQAASPLPILLQPPSWSDGLQLEDVSAIDSDRSVQASPNPTVPGDAENTKAVSFEDLPESDIRMRDHSAANSPKTASPSDRPATTARLSEIMGEKGSELEDLDSSTEPKILEIEPTSHCVESISTAPVMDTSSAHEALLPISGSVQLDNQVDTTEVICDTGNTRETPLKIRSMESTKTHSLTRVSHAGSLQLLPVVAKDFVLNADSELLNAKVGEDVIVNEVPLEVEPEHKIMESKTDTIISEQAQLSDNITDRRTSFSRTYPPRPEVSVTHQGTPSVMMSSSQVNGQHPFSRASQLRESDTSQPQSCSSGSRSSRFSMIELSNVNERPLHASCSALPPTPQVHMGACFSLVFEGCPLKINSTAMWINPMNNGQVILFGTNDGIYYLSLKDLADSSLELLFPRRCLWLSVVRDTMMSLSGRHPQLYSHNLISLMKLKSQGHPMNGKLNRLSNLFPRRFSPSQKVPETKGCRRVSVTRSPFNGAKYLCAAIGNEILVMEWYNTISSFIKIKKVSVPDMPSPLLTFDLFIVKERPLPLVCLGVYRHHSRRGRENQRYRLHLVDLNTCAPFSPTSQSHTSPDQSSTGLNQHSSKPDIVNGDSSLAINGKVSANEVRKLKQKAEYERRNALFLPEDILPVVEAVQLEHNTILVCLQDCAKVINLSGRIKSSRHRATTLDFNGNMAESVVCLRDSILVFHPNGLLGKSFTGELTQEIHDEKHIYRLLGCDRNIIVESRPADDPMSNSNVYILAGHTDSYTQ